jgi:endonuclease G
MAGLHFAGETAGDEHALACLPASVFEKLQITLSPPAPEQLEAAGYDPEFLTERVDVPKPGPKIAKDIARTTAGDTLVEHTHFSLQMSASRRFARWVAWNIDGGALKSLPRRGIEFVLDPQLDDDHQIGDELYRNNDLDRGHIARRADLLWGPLPEARRANIDSFYFSNITPQMNDFNQSTKGGVWGELEDAVFADVEVDDLKLSAFGGPIFQTDDRVYRGVALPREYWKVLAYREGGELKARAFLLTQNLNQLEILELDEFRAFQVSIAELEERTHLRFPDPLRAANGTTGPEALAERQPLSTTADISW